MAERDHRGVQREAVAGNSEPHCRLGSLRQRVLMCVGKHVESAGNNKPPVIVYPANKVVVSLVQIHFHALVEVVQLGSLRDERATHVERERYIIRSRNHGISPLDWAGHCDDGRGRHQLRKQTPAIAATAATATAATGERGSVQRHGHRVDGLGVVRHIHFLPDSQAAREVVRVGANDRARRRVVGTGVAPADAHSRQTHRQRARETALRIREEQSRPACHAAVRVQEQHRRDGGSGREARSGGSSARSHTGRSRWQGGSGCRTGNRRMAERDYRCV